MSLLRSWFRGPGAAVTATESAEASSSSSSSFSSHLHILTNDTAPRGAAAANRGSFTLTLPQQATSAAAAGALWPVPLSPAAQREMSDIEDADAAAAMIIDDDIDEAEARLRAREGSSSFHELALSMAAFMRAALSMEKDLLADAAKQLAATEARAQADMRKAQREADREARNGGVGPRDGNVGGRVSQIYPPGTEFELCYAEAQMMSALVGIMQESVTETLKGFYKLRKAYLALNAIMQAEQQFLDKWRAERRGGSGAGIIGRTEETTKRTANTETKPPIEKMPGGFEDDEFDVIGGKIKTASDTQSMQEKDRSGEESPGNEFVDASESATPEDSPANKTEFPGDASGECEELTRRVWGARLADATDENKASGADLSPHASQQSRESAKVLRHVRELDADEAALFASPVDIFIHSGVNLCSGMLLVVISMIPATFSRLLSIIGFRGDRERGAHLLWRSTRHPGTIYGAIAGLTLMTYYNGNLGFADILPTERDKAELADAGEADLVGFPRRKVSALLGDMRASYPRSPLWKIEAGRALAHERRLEDAVALLRENECGAVRQVVSLNHFELAMDALYTSSWRDMLDRFVVCAETSKWSPALYAYFQGCAAVELYRDEIFALGGGGGSSSSSSSSPSPSSSSSPLSPPSASPSPAPASASKRAEVARSSEHKRRARECFEHATRLAGRRRFMSRPMPLEAFVARKVGKWQARAAAVGGGVDLVDAIVVSPAIEMVYLWNGARRMNPAELDRARAHLAPERSYAGCEAAAADSEKDRGGGATRRMLEAHIEANERDELAIRALAMVALLREQGRLEEARQELEEVLRIEKSIFTGPHRDDYCLAAAHYEAAALAWADVSDPTRWPFPSQPSAPADDYDNSQKKGAGAQQESSAANHAREEGGDRQGATSSSSSSGSKSTNGAAEAVDQFRREKLDRVEEYLAKVVKWDHFVLDARIGMRVSPAVDTVRWIKKKKGWPLVALDP